MASELLDPSGTEPEVLFNAADFRDARILEVGSGDGRLTFRYAEVALFVVGIDPNAEAVAGAIPSRPSRLRRHVSFLPADAQALPFRDGSFDIVLFSWSL
jgi:ubiquinone/menaquinone biosynthesis C-methylase UbiE